VRAAAALGLERTLLLGLGVRRESGIETGVEEVRIMASGQE